MFFLLGVSFTSLRETTPDVLDKSPEEVYSAMLNACEACVTTDKLADEILTSGTYNTLRKAAYSEDKLVRLLALRSLASLASYSHNIRHRLASTMNFEKSQLQNFDRKDLVKALETDNERLNEVEKLYHLKPNKDYINSAAKDIDSLLVFAFDDLVKSVIQDKACHDKLLSFDYQNHLLSLLSSSDKKLSSFAISGFSGLSHSYNGRIAMVNCDVFPKLYQLIYPSDSKPIYDAKTIINGKFALQQLLVSQSAMDAMLPKYGDFFLTTMSPSSKHELLVSFSLENEIEHITFAPRITQLAIGSVFGFFYSLIPSAVLKNPRFIRSAFYSSSYSLTISSIALGFGSREFFLTHDKDRPFLYLSQITLTSSAAFLAYAFAPKYSILPIFISLMPPFFKNPSLPFDFNFNFVLHLLKLA